MSTTFDGGGLSASWTLFATSPVVNAAVRGASEEQPLRDSIISTVKSTFP